MSLTVHIVAQAFIIFAGPLSVLALIQTNRELSA